MKILSVLLNQFGSAYVRQYVPMQALMNSGRRITIVDAPTVPQGTLAAHDVIQLSRVAGLDTTAAVERIRWLQNMGLQVILDYDDDLLGIPSHNPAHSHTNPQAVIKAIEAADAITVTSDALAAVYRPYAKRMAVIPNYMDVAHWPKDLSAQRINSGITIGLVGSASHYEDWKLAAPALHRIREAFPDVKLLTAGFCPDYLTEIVTEHVSWQNIFAYQTTVNRIDIGLCPLLDDDFNKRKTALKAYEYGMASAAVVASPILYRSTVQGRGALARTDEEWYRSIKNYIINPELRQRDGKALHDYVVRHLDVRRHTTEIYQTYRTLFKSPGVTPNGNHHYRTDSIYR